MPDFGDRWRRARKRASYDSQDDLAKALGLKSRQVISDIETGKSDPNRERIVRFCQLTDTNPTWLLTGRGPETMSDALSGRWHEGARHVAKRVQDVIEEVLEEEELGGLLGGRGE